MTYSSHQTPAEQEEFLSALKAQYAIGVKIVNGLLTNQEQLGAERSKLVLSLKEAAANLDFVLKAPIPILSEYQTVKLHYAEISDGLKDAEEKCERNFTLLAAAQADILQLRALIEEVESNPIDNVRELRT